MDEVTSPPVTHPVSSRLGYLIRRASSTMMAHLGAKLATIGLRPVEATILTLVDANAGCTQSDIGRLLGIKRANMVPLIAGLLDKGMLQKLRVDGRSFALSLTAEGEKALRRAVAIMDEHDAAFEMLIDDQDKQCLIATLARIVESGKDC